MDVFYQTWFFFGLLGEFYTLNELEDGSRLTDITSASQQLATLYTDFIVTKEGKQCLSGAKLFEPEQSIKLTALILESPTG